MNATTTLPSSTPEIDLGAFKSRKSCELDLGFLVDQVREGNPADMAFEIAEAISECVKYQRGSGYWNSYTRANCIGTTALMTESLERRGIEQRVLYVNHHAFSLVVEDPKIHMVHVETPELCIRDIAQDSRAEEMLGPRQIAAIISQVEPIGYYSLSTEKLASRSFDKDFAPDWLDALYPATAIMEPAAGREALHAYLRLLGGLGSGKIEHVNSALARLKGRNPQAETRPRVSADLHRFRELVGSWSDDPSIPTELLTETILRHEDAMPVKTKSLDIFIGDCLRRAGKTREESELLDRALDSYAQAMGSSKTTSDQTLLGKVRKTRAILSDCLTDERARPSSR